MERPPFAWSFRMGERFAKSRQVRLSSSVEQDHRLPIRHLLKESMLLARDPGAVRTEATWGGEDMRRLVVLIVLTLAAFSMLPRAAAAADASVTGMEWWVYPRLNKHAFQRYETARARYGVYVYVSPMDVASSARLSSELQVRRHYAKRPHWRRVHTWSPNIDVPLAPREHLAAVDNHFSFTARWKRGRYQLRFRIWDDASGLGVSTAQAGAPWFWIK